jgi:hypothetical protein
MWLFTPFGFYSVVRKTPGSQLTIRGRTWGDLVRLRARYLPTATEPQAHGGTDYPWRMRCEDQALAAAMPQIVLDITYANFKDAVAQELGSARAHRYHTVWHALYGMPEDAPEPASHGHLFCSPDCPEISRQVHMDEFHASMSLCLARFTRPFLLTQFQVGRRDFATLPDSK